MKAQPYLYMFLFYLGKQAQTKTWNYSRKRPIVLHRQTEDFISEHREKADTQKH
jgi:hypothetical protein